MPSYIIVQSLIYGYNLTSPFTVKLNVQSTHLVNFKGIQSSKQLKAAITDPVVSKVDAISG